MNFLSIYKTEKYRIFNFFGLKIKIRRPIRFTIREKRWLNKLIDLYELHSINRDEIESKVENMRRYGLNEEHRSPRIIVSLTSYPKRMYDIHLCIYSLLTQEFKPDKVVLWLGEDRFLDKELDVPRKVRELCKFGLEIRWCKDLRSHTKLIPALKEFPNDIIVTADDDRFYDSLWLKKLWDGYCVSKTITSLYAKTITFRDRSPELYDNWIWCSSDFPKSVRNMLFGYGGVLYPPQCLHSDVFNTDTALELCPTADDIWFWCMAVLNETPIYRIPGNHITCFTNGLREFNLNKDGTLHSVNENDAGGNQRSLELIYRKYPRMLDILYNDLSNSCQDL